MKKLIALFITVNTLALNPGKIAPNFSLKNQENKSITLNDFKGKYVVLEWYNYGCPYVRKHYDSQNMQETQKKARENNKLVWLKINSSAPGKQGFLKDFKNVQERLKIENSQATHLLNDPDGVVGRLFAAKTTPQIFIIDPKGVVQYNGAIDSIASADKSDISQATNYVTSSLSKIYESGVAKPSKTKPYGCSVKY